MLFLLLNIKDWLTQYLDLGYWSLLYLIISSVALIVLRKRIFMVATSTKTSAYIFLANIFHLALILLILVIFSICVLIKNTIFVNICIVLSPLLLIGVLSATYLLYFLPIATLLVNIEVLSKILINRQVTLNLLSLFSYIFISLGGLFFLMLELTAMFGLS